MKRKMFAFLLAAASVATWGAPYEHAAPMEVSRIELNQPVPVEVESEYDSVLRYRVDSFVPGALAAHSLLLLDASGKTLRRADSVDDAIAARGMEQTFRIRVRTGTDVKFLQPQLLLSGNPVRITVLGWKLEKVVPTPLFKGVYDAFDPAPSDRSAALEEMKKIKPASARVERRGGRPVLIVDGKPTPLNAYKGDADYRIFGEAGGDVVITFNLGGRLFASVPWDAAALNPVSGRFDFRRIEDNLLRIHRANPRARVIVNLGLDADRRWLEEHPDHIFCNEKKERGRIRFGAFTGFGNQPLDEKDIMRNWAVSYAGKEYKKRIGDALRKFAAFLKNSPAGNIVIGFQLSGGHDGQFVQWQYGDFNGHFDYSEANRKALCEYLRELYGSDAALQQAWGDPGVMLGTAANPPVSEYKKYKYLDDRPGPGRKIADCRRFISIGTARMLNEAAAELKKAWNRPAVVEVWYSTALWAQPGRLALDELIRNRAVDMVGMVSYYAPLRRIGDRGAAANSCIAALNLRNILYIQELDHRTWRTQRTSGIHMNRVAFPKDAPEFRAQLLREASAVIAAGGHGFYLYDMFGSWYHDPEAMKTVRSIFRMNRHATECTGMFPAPRAAIFLGEATRLMSEHVPTSAVNAVWRGSGITPAVHHLEDLGLEKLPEYDFYTVVSPIAITRKEAEELKRRTDRPGKVLLLIGDAGRSSRDFSGTGETLAFLGLNVKEHLEPTAEEVMIDSAVSDPLTAGMRGRVGIARGTALVNGRLRRSVSYGFASVNDSAAKILGYWEKSRLPALAVKKTPGGGTLIYCAVNGGVTPQLLHNAAKIAGITPYGVPGNVIAVGNGVAGVHRITELPAEVDFGTEVELFDVDDGRPLGRSRKWKPECAIGGSVAVLWRPPHSGVDGKKRISPSAGR